MRKPKSRGAANCLGLESQSLEERQGGLPDKRKVPEAEEAQPTM